MTPIRWNVIEQRSRADQQYTALVHAGMYSGDSYAYQLRARRRSLKKWAKKQGWSGNGGGWIYNVRGVPLVQGWDNLERVVPRRMGSWVGRMVNEGEFA